MTDLVSSGSERAGTLPAGRPHHSSLGRFGTAWTAFVEGLITPSPLAIGIAIVVNAVVFTALVVGLTPDFISRQHETMLAERGTDYDAIVTARMLGLQAEAVLAPSIVILGGSTTRASLLEADLIEELRTRRLPGYRVVKLCTSRQSLWETLALAENLPTALSGVVIIGVGPSLFTMGDDALEELASHPRLGIRSEQLDEAFRQRQFPVAPRTGLYFLDNAAFVLPRLDDVARKAFRDRPTPYVDSRYVAGPKQVDQRAEAFIQDRAERVEARFRLYDRHRATNFALLEKVIGTIGRGRTLQVILVETPINPAFVRQHHLEPVVDRHRGLMRTFARNRGLAYVELNRAAALEPDDFFDWAHLDDRDAVRRSAAAVIAVLPPLLERLGAAQVR